MENGDGTRGTRLYGVIGHPVAHSLSPFMMNRAFRQLEVDAVYLRFDVVSDRLDCAVDGLAALGAYGANVTYPFKTDILRFVDVPSPDAELIGAANTLAFRDGKVVGHNTDASGAATALATFGRVALRDKRVLILGGGASARAATLGLLREGSSEVTLGVRSPETVAPFVERIRRAFPEQGIDTVSLAPRAPGERGRERASRFERADVVINATPVGMGEHADTQLVEDPGWIRPGQCFFDFVYNPGNTAFLKTAADRGARVLGGLSLLVCQAVDSFRLWTGQSFDAPAMYEALEAAFPERSAG